MKRVAIGLCLMLITTGARGADANAVRAALESITASELQKHVEVLADDSFEGRESGSRGGRAAGGYLVGKLKQLGLSPAGEGGDFYQSFSGGSRNILAMLEGSDPVLKKQYVVLGGHYDHVGYGNRSNSYGPTGRIHNGADDNASGVAGLLEVAEAFTKLPTRPKRSVVFAMWDGEEKGLLGSKHWLADPTLPPKNIVLYLNVDMIGRLRNTGLEVYGTRTSYGLRELVSRGNDENVRLDFTWLMKEDSDHYPFFQRNIPTLMFHTGLHENYHRPSDDAHLINKQGLQQISRLMFEVLREVADSDRSLKFRAESRREDPAGRRALEQALAPAGSRLGLEWKDGATTDEGVVVTKVLPLLPAAKAGLLPGDRIVRFGNKQVTAKLPLRKLILAARSPVEVEVIRKDRAEPLKVAVKLSGEPTRLGLAWNDDPAAPGTVLVTRVVYGSATYQAGLRERDRIYEVGGQRFANNSEFYKLATTLPGPFEMLYERAGQLHRATVEPPEME